MPLNPDCTPGWTEPLGAGHVGRCGCGWSSEVQPSKTKAKAAQRDHRFPPREPVGEDPFATAAPPREDHPMTQPDPPPVSAAPQPALLEPSDSVPVPVDDMGRYITGTTAIEEGVCRDCGRLLYRATAPDKVDVWHPWTVLDGLATARFDGTHVTSQPGECAGATVGVGRPDPTAFVIGVPLVPTAYIEPNLGPQAGDVVGSRGPDGRIVITEVAALPCYICGAPDNHAEGASPYEAFDCPSELTRAAADALRALVGLADIVHPRRRDDRV